MNDSRARFTGRVEAYRLYRQRYPAAQIIDHLRHWCGLQPSWTVADIGAGTGMLSEVFLANGNRVLAIEPNVEMRASCERLRAQWPQLQVIDAAAENTTLADNSVHMVSAGRAFHWFDHHRALQEFHRILRPHGWAALISSGRANDSSDQAESFEHLLTTFGTDVTYVRGSYRIHANVQDIFPCDVQKAAIPGEQRLTWKEFRGQTLSLSITPLPVDKTFGPFEHALREYFERFARDGILTMATTCWITVGRFSTR